MPYAISSSHLVYQFITSLNVPYLTTPGPPFSPSRTHLLRRRQRRRQRPAAIAVVAAVAATVGQQHRDVNHLSFGRNDSSILGKPPKNEEKKMWISGISVIGNYRCYSMTKPSIESYDIYHY